MAGKLKLDEDLLEQSVSENYVSTLKMLMMVAIY